MGKLLLLAAASWCCVSQISRGGEPLWTDPLDAPNAAVSSDLLEAVPGREKVLHLSAGAGQASPRTVQIRLPLQKIRGKPVFFGADVRAANISKKPNPWNGVKVMLVIETPAGKSYPQPDVPEGTIDWRRFSNWVAVPGTATNVFLVVGLENVTGEAWFDNLSITAKPSFHSTLKTDPTRPVFLGHTQPRLRGAMAGTDLTEEDVRYFATVWKGNLLRLQLFEAAARDRALDTYDAWLEQRLRHIDEVLSWCRKYRIMAVLDLHSPPGGQAFSAGYITARGRIFTDRAAQAKFVQVWERMAARYKDNHAIWGFDLVNEPDDSLLGEDCLDWNSLADKAARAVRAIDPNRTLIIEPNQWGSPAAFESFQPLDLAHIVYSFHFYQPMQFTHQGLYNNPAGVTYPGVIENEHWDKAALERAMEPALNFATKYRVQMYVGEFSAIRTAPGNSAAAYLADVIDIFEMHGFDWSYHAYREWQGWSLEHEGSLDHPRRAQIPTDRQQVIAHWFSRN